MSDAILTVTAPRDTGDDLIIAANNQQISGWEDISVTRCCDRLPNTFEVTLTETLPGGIPDVVVRPGDICEVLIGKDLVVTGYVDRYEPAISARGHTVKITGRGKCEDLVDCAAIVGTYQIAAGSALSIASAIAKPYGINVSAPDGPGKPVSLFCLMPGETCFEVIDRCARSAGLLAYEDASGGLVLAQIGKVSAASGFAEGQNVQAATFALGMDQRFSDYVVYQMALAKLSDIAPGFGPVARVKDTGVPRFREKIIMSEIGADGQDISQLRAVWERNRRIGRSFQLQVVADSWRDSAGKLWAPNTLVPVHLPTLKIEHENWVIGSVTYTLNDQSGTTASLEIMPPEAFSIEPVLPSFFVPLDLRPPK